VALLIIMRQIGNVMKNSFFDICKINTVFKYVVLVLLGVIIGLLTLTMQLTYVVAIIGAMAIVMCSLYKPEIVIIIIVILISSIIDIEKLPLISFGLGSLHISDLLLLVLMAVAFAKNISDKNVPVRKTILNKALVGFCLLAMFSAYNSIANFGVDMNIVIRILRPVGYYMLFYVITQLIASTEQINFLVNALFIVAVLVVIAMVIQAAAGDSIQLIPGPIEEASGLDEDFDALRIRPPGQTLIFISLIAAICFVVLRKGKSLFLCRYFYVAIMLGVGIMLTYTRTYLVAIFLSAMLFLYFSRNEDRKRLVSLMAGSMTFIILFLILSWGAGLKIDNTINAISQRVLTLFAGENLTQSSSLNDRHSENWYAMEQIKEHPILGSGLGKVYRPELYGSEDEIAFYVHNVYLWITLDMGVFGLAFFIWFYAGYLIRAVRNYNNPEDELQRSVAMGSMLSGISMFPMGLVIPLFMEAHSIVIVAIFMGLSETIIINTQKQTEHSGALTSERIAYSGILKH
jgi:O-antigen ligase